MLATRRSSRAAELAATATPADPARESDGQAGSLYTLAEVARHNTPKDCWVTVRRQVYDVTAWVPKHPGGHLITIQAGRDCTQLFDSYHPVSARAVLAKHYIGDLAPGEAQDQGQLYQEDQVAEGSFYAVLKQRVYGHLRANKIQARTSTALYVKTGLILGTLVLSYYGAFFAFTSSVAATLVSAIILGIAMAEVGVSIQHDANHGAFSTDSRIGAVLGASLDLVGASSFMWRQQHVAGHHVWTNVHGLDPDIRVSEADVRRVTPFQPLHQYQAYQHLYLGALYGLLAVKSVLVDDFQALASGAIGSVRLKPLTRGEAAIFWGGKAAFALLFVAAPLAWSGHSWGLLAAAWAISEIVTGWMLAFLFQVAHVVDEVAYLQPDGSAPNVPSGWAAAQVAASADFSHGSFFWTHFSGGLNYQVVHHLFPGIAHTHYPTIAPIVVQTCKEFGVPYRVYPTFLSAISAHFRHLKSMGRKGALLTMPSLTTIG